MRSRKVPAVGIEVFEVHAVGEKLVVISLPLGPRTPPRGLTAAEREVTNDVLAGRSTTAIARRRKRSPRTIANQLASIYRKLGVSSRTELAARLCVKDDT